MSPNIQTEEARSRIGDGSNKENPACFLKSFFDFGFFLMLHPFRFCVKNKWEQGNGKYQIVCILPQQIICGITQFLALFRLGLSIRKVPVENIMDDSSIYFTLIQSVMSLFYHATVFYMLWFKRHILSKAINQIVSHAVSYPTKSTSFYKMFINPKLIALGLCTFYTVKSVLDILVGYNYIKINRWSLKALFSAYVEEGRYMLFLSQNTSTPDERAIQSNDFSFTIYNLLIAFIMAVVQFYREITVHFSDLGLLLFAFTLLWHANAFKYNVQISINANEEFRDEILKQYETLKRTSRILNQAFAPVALLFLFEAIPYYSAHLGDFLVINDWYHRARFIFFMSQFAVILLIAAEVSHKMNCLQEWLGNGENYDKIPHSKLTFLLHELSIHPIGLSINGIATISYKQLATLLSIIVTYFIIMLQFQAGACLCGGQEASNRRGRNVTGAFGVPFIIF